jgi:hypothetical protein
MLSRLAISWAVLAALFGFFVGGSVVWSTLERPHAQAEKIGSSTQHEPSAGEPKSQKEETDEALAYYTLWLMVFTGILALATIVLMSATIGLYFTGEKQVAVAKQAADAAMLSAQAAIGIELPVLGVAPPDLHSIDEPLVPGTGYAYVSGYAQEMLSRYSVIPWMHLRNAGRTPAFLTEFAIGNSISVEASATPEFDGIYRLVAGEIVERLEKTSVELHYQITLADDQIAVMKEKKAFLWLTVRVRYLDFLSNAHEATFHWKWDNPGGGSYFFDKGGGPYTQWTPAS